MKKILLLTLAAMLSSAAYAQSFQILDADGNDVSGKTIDVYTEEHIDPFTGPYLVANSNLFVKNISAVIYQCKADFSITEMTNGMHQICLDKCVVQESTGDYATGYKPIKAGESVGLLAEWLPASGASEGKCVVTYNTSIYTAKQNGSDYEYTKVKDGPSVTVNYILGEAGVKDLEANKEVASVTYYDMCGCQVANPTFGLYIKRVAYTDGSVESVKLSVK